MLWCVEIDLLLTRPWRTQPTTAMIHEVATILTRLGLPPELALAIVYRHGGVMHPTAQVWKTDPWLRATLVRCGALIAADRSRGDRATRTITCTCSLSADAQPRAWTMQRMHRAPVPRHWTVIVDSSRVWHARTRGPGKRPVFDTVRCAWTVLCLRVNAVANDLDTDMNRGAFPHEDYVTGEDPSLATWLRHAPLEALEEYAAGVTGWEQEVMATALAGPGRRQTALGLIMSAP